MTKQRHFLLITILGALTALGPFSIDLYLPGFPAIATSFGITTSKVTLSLSSFFLGIALGQILYGPLLDRFGRKKPLYAGLALYLAASAGCYFAPNIEALIVLRFIQAIGSCAAGVVSMAMVRDLFPVEENAKIFALLLLVLGASPMIAPTLGGFIAAAFGWRAIFIGLFILALAILFTTVFFLPESRQPDPEHSLKAKPILLGFLRVLKNPQFLTYSVGGGIALSGLFAYVTDSPMIFMEGYGVSNRTYGWIFAALAIGFVSSSQLNRYFQRRFNPGQIISGAISCMVITSLIFIYGLQHNWFNIVGTAVLIFIFLSCMGILNPHAAALSMAPFEHNAGTAASLFGLVQWGIAGISGFAVSMFQSKTPVPLALVMTVSALLSMVIFYTGGRVLKNQLKVSAGNVPVMH
jgi:DHA1 family bicyclomycin/chloramphenicol resistance-like MFS transporter